MQTQYVAPAQAVIAPASGDRSETIEPSLGTRVAGIAALVVGSLSELLNDWVLLLNRPRLLKVDGGLHLGFAR
jgi:hypothetical protein